MKKISKKEVLHLIKGQKFISATKKDEDGIIKLAINLDQLSVQEEDMTKIDEILKELKDIKVTLNEHDRRFDVIDKRLDGVDKVFKVNKLKLA